jgi:hypothetical protein
MTSATGSSVDALECQIGLIDSEPLIWRRFCISERASLARLHTVIQVVMGWKNQHSYEFRLANDRYTDATVSTADQYQDATAYTLADCGLQPGSQLLYLYDFGDGWLHRVVVEARSPLSPESPLPVCLDGEQACPPENSGGVWGYEGLLERLNDPDDPEYEELLDAIGIDFDPDKFDIQAVNQQLAALC